MNGSFSEKTHYIFEGTEPIFEKRIKSGQADKIRSYVYAGVKLIARVDGVIGSTTAKKYWYHTDHLGSVKAVTKADGTLAWKADYFSFGQQYGKEKIDPTFEEDDLGFTGKGFDADIGLYYFNARWYDADLGRFISEDPTQDGLNWYIYCRNNPVNVIDPTGLYGNPSDPGAMVGPTNPNNAIDYGGGSTSGPTGSLSSTLDQSKSDYKPKTLAEIAEQLQKDYPRADIKLDEQNRLLIQTNINETINIDFGNAIVTINAETIMIELSSFSENGIDYSKFHIVTSDHISNTAINLGRQKIKVGTGKDTGNPKMNPSTEEKMVGGLKVTKESNYVSINLELVIGSDNSINASGTVRYGKFDLIPFVLIAQSNEKDSKQADWSNHKLNGKMELIADRGDGLFDNHAKDFKLSSKLTGSGSEFRVYIWYREPSALVNTYDTTYINFKFK